MVRGQIDEIKEKLDILEVIGDYVPLKKVGKNYRGLCPFHSEKTPSFYVSPERQTYHCFGCGRGGDVFSFIMEKEGLTFPEALRFLAERAGVKLEEGKGSRKNDDIGIFDVMEEASKFFRDQLWFDAGIAALKYLARRGLKKEDILAFEIGWAPDSWDSLKRHLERKNGKKTVSIALDAGLLIKGPKGIYDRFRGRVIFPIRDVRGKLIGFGGRIISGEGVKYINSPESPIFMKRSSLFLLNRAKGHIREKKRAILVEGYMDALKLHIKGFPESVATLGTAVTEEQAALLKRFTERVFLCYDADVAGQEANLRGMYVLQRMGLDVRIVSLPIGKDPDDLLSTEKGGEDFRKLLDLALPLPLYHVKLKEPELRDESLRTRARREILEGLASLPSLEANSYLPEVARGLGMVLSEVIRSLEEFRKNIKDESVKKGFLNTSYVNINVKPSSDVDKKSNIHPLEAVLCYILWTDEKRRSSEAPERLLPLFNQEEAKAIALALLQGEEPEELRERWLEAGDTWPLALLAAGAAHIEEYPQERVYEVVVEALERRAKMKRFEVLKNKKARGVATIEEIIEFSKLAKFLKGGQGKHESGK